MLNGHFKMKECIVNYAPIVIFCYRRLEVLKKTVESLLKNKECKDSLCFIFSDGPKDENDAYYVKQVREYIRSITGFKKTTIIESSVNKGLASSIIDGVTRVVNQYGKIIVLEDDLLVGAHFLKYMNDALELYKEDNDVGCISGYVYPVNQNKSSFFIRGADCWGWATWLRAWNFFNNDGVSLLKDLFKNKLTSDFNFDDAYPYVEMLEDQIVGKNDSWAIRWYASLYLKNMLCLYPGKTLVRNIGFGVDGAAHCKESTCSYDSEIINTPLNIDKLPLFEEQLDRSLFSAFLKDKQNCHPNSFKLKKERIVVILKKIIIPIYKFKKKASLFLFEKFGIFEKAILGYDGFSGDYYSFDTCKKKCIGYDNKDVLKKTLDSTLKVKYGYAVFERDSYIFDSIQYSYPLLTALFKVALENNNELSVLDFGGALGSHYFQNRNFLNPIRIKKWSVVEQSHYIDLGNKLISDGILNFYHLIDDVDVGDVDVLILSGVLQYLDDPYSWLDKFLNKGFKYIIFDRTAFSLENRNRLTIQVVPKYIYDASYPAWFLNEKEFLGKFVNYDILLNFENTIDVVHEIPSVYKGYLFKRKN